jgi:ABC-type antimicrobial peptide transport system permease subunit
MALLPTIGRVVADIDPNIPLQKPMTLAAQFDESAGQVRLFARLAFAFGVLAAFLVAVGLYGTLSYRVSRRSIEIGVRMALGAQRDQILWMVLRESLLLTAIGIAIGFPLSLLLGQLLQSTLYGLGAHDPLTLAAAAFGVLAVALLATFVPARTAASVNPMQALRSE